MHSSSLTDLRNHQLFKRNQAMINDLIQKRINSSQLNCFQMVKPIDANVKQSTTGTTAQQIANSKSFELLNQNKLFDKSSTFRRSSNVNLNDNYNYVNSGLMINSMDNTLINNMMINKTMTNKMTNNMMTNTMTDNMMSDAIVNSSLSNYNPNNNLGPYETHVHLKQVNPIETNSNLKSSQLITNLNNLRQQNLVTNEKLIRMPSTLDDVKAVQNLSKINKLLDSKLLSRPNNLTRLLLSHQAELTRLLDEQNQSSQLNQADLSSHSYQSPAKSKQDNELLMNFIKNYHQRRLHDSKRRLESKRSSNKPSGNDVLIDDRVKLKKKHESKVLSSKDRKSKNKHSTDKKQDKKSRQDIDLDKVKIKMKMIKKVSFANLYSNYFRFAFN